MNTKTSSSSAEADDARLSPDEASTDPVESIIEDLSQQDVMPSGETSSLEGIPDLSKSALLQSQGWDEAGADYGERTPRRPLEDETNISERLVNNGIAEADEELRELEELDTEEDSEKDSDRSGN